MSSSDSSFVAVVEEASVGASSVEGAFADPWAVRWSSLDSSSVEVAVAS